MSDERLRALERRWQETGAEEDELAWDQERERQGLPPRVTVVEVLLESFEIGDPLPEERPGQEAWAAALANAERRTFAPWLVCDLSAVRDFQSTVLVRFLEAHHRLERAGGGLVLCGISPKVWTVFELLGHEDLLPVSATVVSCLEERAWTRRGQPLPLTLRVLL